MTEPRRDTDETREPLPVPEAAARLGLSIDAVRMRVRRGTLPTVEIDGKKHVLVPRSVTDATRRDTDATATEPPHGADMLDQLRAEIAYLRTTLDAEIEARRRADHLLAGVIDERRDLLRQLEAGTERRRDSDATVTVEDAAVDANTGPLRGDQPIEATDTPRDQSGGAGGGG